MVVSGHSFSPLHLEFELIAMYAPPRITTLDATLLPPAPDGWHYVHITSPDVLDSDLEHYPVVLFGPYTYTGAQLVHSAYGFQC